ncbi:winged helix-turn-helix transcriptional regulator [Mangrovicoccus algicola]|uniref:Helix-turn-helix transcriptional regulator n=1 Tax=Mangrovicoccus algicola TaxID=2771008 RepID=A0A8J6Z918_9RHOB|nr:helix-turn-helix domain-containing protein [Mangrovicoccus algicola]MBE3638480.1 helix-turn-helix transcriptional regulator [Mangrovicoccus algicola]
MTRPEDTAPAGEDPLCRATRLLGDRWTLLILRDIMFDGHRGFRELKDGSREGIASNILSARLKRMVAAGLLTRAPQADARRRRPYALTEAAIALLPAIVELCAWGLDPAPGTGDLRARLFYGGGPRLWRRFQDELRAEHLQDRPARLSIRVRLSEAEGDVINGFGPIALPADRAA